MLYLFVILYFTFYVACEVNSILQYVFLNLGIISGNFEALEYFIMDLNTNITVSEDVKGQASLETFTLLWGGVPSLPLPFNASETEVFLCFIFLNIYHSIKCWLLQYCVQNILNALLKYPFST